MNPTTLNDFPIGALVEVYNPLGSELEVRGRIMLVPSESPKRVLVFDGQRFHAFPRDRYAQPWNNPQPPQQSIAR